MANLPVSIKHPYRYDPLASQDSIRLIKVNPNLIYDHHISCIISEHALPQATDVPKVEYRALSYVWGDPQDSRRIFLRDETDTHWYNYKIHSNLWLFLAHMWRKKQFECLLWTDRLCLNQHDGKEMAQQIPRMALIYSQAENVIIWLGLSAWEEKFFQEHREFIQNGSRQVEGPHRSALPPDSQHWLAICSVQDHPYWKRMWITQEVAMAQKVVVEMQDTPSFDLQEMRQAVASFPSNDGEQQWSLIDFIDLRGSAGTIPLQPKCSWKLLQDHCHRLCTYQQDRIYGLLGMVEENDPILQIPIDYNKPTSDVLFDALFTAADPSLKEVEFGIIEALMSIGLLEDVNSLEEYSNKDHSWKLTDNMDVKKFARITLGVFDALNFMAIFGGLTFWHYSTEEILTSISLLKPFVVDKFQWKAIIGIILAIGVKWASKETHEQWKEVRWPKFKVQWQSLWLCSKHTLQLAPEHLRVETIIPLSHDEFPPKEIVRACRYYPPHGSQCEGSRMSLEVPNSGTRLELDYTTPGTQGEHIAVLIICFKNGALLSA